DGDHGMAEGEIAEGEMSVGREVNLLANLRSLVFDPHSGGEGSAGRIFYGEAQFAHVFLGGQRPGDKQCERGEGRRGEGARETLRHRDNCMFSFHSTGRAELYAGRSASRLNFMMEVQP